MEENLRKAERSKVYPFLPEDVTIPSYEQTLVTIINMLLLQNTKRQPLDVAVSFL